MKISSTKRSLPRLQVEKAAASEPKPNDGESPADLFLQSGAALGLGAGAGALAFTDYVTTDKTKHMGVTGAATLALTAVGMKPTAAAATVFAGATIGKELILDKLLGKGTASWLDTAANLSGVLGALAIIKFGQGVGELTAPRQSLG